MKAKMLLIILIVGLMGLLSPAWADAQQDQGVAFNKIKAPYGTTVSALFRHYHKSGGQYSYEEFLAAYCTLQGMKNCEDADFRKLPVGYWKVPAAPVFTTIKHVAVPAVAAVSIASPVVVPAPVVAPVVAQQPVTQPAAKIPPVALQTFAMPAVETSAKPAEKVAAAQSVTPAAPVAEVQTEAPSSYFGAFPAPKQTVARVEPPIAQATLALAPPEVRSVVTVKALGTVSVLGLATSVFAVVLMMALGISYSMWRFFKKKFNRDVEAVLWHRDLLSKDYENTERERLRLLREKKEAVEIIKDLSAQLVDTQIELTEAQTVAQRFDLPEGLMRENFIPFIYLAKDSKGRVRVGENPDPMQFGSVHNHLMNNEWSRKFYGMVLSHRLNIASSLMPVTSAG